MTRSEFIHKVRQRIDEVGINETVSLNFPIDAFLAETTNQTLLDAPLSMASNIVDFSSLPTTRIENGGGKIQLPTDFTRLVEFKMRAWHRSIYKPYTPSDSIILKQKFKTTRADTFRPVVILYSDHLLYYSIPDTSEHIVEIAKAQISAKSISELPDTLTDAASWLTASKVLRVMNEASLSDGALQQYVHIISTLKSQTT